MELVIRICRRNHLAIVPVGLSSGPLNPKMIGQNVRFTRIVFLLSPVRVRFGPRCVVGAKYDLGEMHAGQFVESKRAISNAGVNDGMWSLSTLLVCGMTRTMFEP